MRMTGRALACAGAAALFGASLPASAQTATAPAPSTAPSTAQSTAPAPAAPAESGSFLLTVFLKHDQSKTLDQINAELREHGFYKRFPPPGIEVVSWYVVMGIGQIVTLRVPADRLREVNRVLEETAWGGYRTEFYPSYDYRAAAEAQRRQMQ